VNDEGESENHYTPKKSRALTRNSKNDDIDDENENIDNAESTNNTWPEEEDEEEESANNDDESRGSHKKGFMTHKDDNEINYGSEKSKRTNNNNNDDRYNIDGNSSASASSNSNSVCNSASGSGSNISITNIANLSASNGSKEPDFEDCVGNIREMCMNQISCRYLQKKLEEGDPDIVSVIFQETVQDIVTLMRDPFGNYLCQRLLEKCDDEQRSKLIQCASKQLVYISKNMHGTRAVQKIIDTASTSDQIKAIKESLRGSVITLIEDLNGNHVIQRCLLRLEPKDNQFIYDAVAKHCVQVATHRHGCCVLQRCIDNATNSQKQLLFSKIEKHCLVLVQDAFGNYVVQYVLDGKMPEVPTRIIVRLQGYLKAMSLQKFSSNVVEKCIKVGNSECISRILCELLHCQYNPGGDPVPVGSIKEVENTLMELIHDSFGNYVVQTCLYESSTKAPREYKYMAEVLAPVLGKLRSVPYNKRIEELLHLNGL